MYNKIRLILSLVGGIYLRRYKDALYSIRHIKDLKDMLETSAIMFGEKNAFLIKNKPGGPYLPIKFKDFKKDVDALGTALLDLGLKDKKIAVIGENRYEWVLSYLAVVNGIGTIVPLDKELPENEIKYLIEKSDASAVIYSDKIKKSVTNIINEVSNLEHVISMDAEEDINNMMALDKLIHKGKALMDNGKREYLDIKLDCDKPSILLFTSGTTGLAKGVMLSHKNICSNIMSMSQYVLTSKQDTILSVLPLHHTYECTCGVMTPIYTGATIAFCEGLKHIVKNLNESKATVMLGVPLLFESMYTRVWRKVEKEGKADKLRKGIKISRSLKKVGIDKAKRMFKSIHEALGGHVRLFISGAAAIDPDIIQCFNDMGIRMIQGYGLTECSPIVALNRDRYSKHGAAGQALPGTEIKIDTPDDKGIGEVLCKSDSIMLGYFENEKETAKVLTDGWFRTGDYGYIDEDGFLFLSGRKKNVIITKNGKNVFPEEVEFYLNKSDYIKECIIFGKEDEESGDALVCANIVLDTEYINELNDHYTEEALKMHIQEVIHDINSKMPLYKRIRRFNIKQEELEKTTTKKIIRYGTNIKL